MNGHDDFEIKRSLDALPRSIEPPEDLWPAVRARIRRSRRVGTRAWRQLAAAAVLLLAVGALFSVRRAQSTWTARAPGGPERHLAEGDVLTTGNTSRLLVHVANIGSVELAPETEARLVSARSARHRLALTRGSLHARISAPPRLFVVETPAATAVDLGCEYTLEVDSLGRSRIHVTLGWVSFEGRDRESLVPAGFLALASPTTGLSTPWAEGAPDSLVRALADLDSTGSPSALRTALSLARTRDAVSLWHLLPRTQGQAREDVYGALAPLAPPPAGVTREGALTLDPLMLRLWWETLPGALPITPEWTRRLWWLWLKATDW